MRLVLIRKLVEMWHVVNFVLQNSRGARGQYLLTAVTFEGRVFCVGTAVAHVPAAVG